MDYIFVFVVFIEEINILLTEPQLCEMGLSVFADSNSAFSISSKQYSV